MLSRRYVSNRSLRHTLEFFLSSKPCKVFIKLSKSKGTKVITAAPILESLQEWVQEPVIDIPEGRYAEAKRNRKINLSQGMRNKTRKGWRLERQHV